MPLVHVKLHPLVHLKGPLLGSDGQAVQVGLLIWFVHWGAYWPGGHSGRLHWMH